MASKVTAKPKPPTKVDTRVRDFATNAASTSDTIKKAQSNIDISKSGKSPEITAAQNADADLLAKADQAAKDAQDAINVANSAIAAGTGADFGGQTAPGAIAGGNKDLKFGDPGYVLRPGDPGYVAPTIQGITAGDNAGSTGGMTPAQIQAAIDAGIQAGLKGLNTKTNTDPNPDYVQAITSLLGSYGIGDLADSVINAVQKGYTPDTISLIMQDPMSNDPLALAYQKRFPANAILFKAGKPVLSPAQYLNTEQTYAQVLQAHGLSQYATPDKFSQLIANDVSPTEVNDRITIAADRIQNADQATKDALAQFYPSLNQKDIMAAVLNPSEGLPALQRKIQVAEIGGAALAQGLDVSQSGDLHSMGANALADLGITKAQAQQGYGNIATILPTAQKLSDIYSTQTPGYDQNTAEQDVFGNLASAQRARQGLSALEQGTFSGQSGVLGASYGTPRSSFNQLTPGQI